MITFAGRMLCLRKWACMVIITLHSSFLTHNSLSAQSLTFVELNCENLFDYHDDVDNIDEVRRTQKTIDGSIKDIVKKVIK